MEFTSPQIMNRAKLFDFAGFLTTISHPKELLDLVLPPSSNFPTHSQSSSGVKEASEGVKYSDY